MVSVNIKFPTPINSVSRHYKHIFFKILKSEALNAPTNTSHSLDQLCNQCCRGAITTKP
jgi:hypothetical protein